MIYRFFGVLALFFADELGDVTICFRGFVPFDRLVRIGILEDAAIERVLGPLSRGGQLGEVVAC